MVITRDNLSIVLKLIVLICQLTLDMMSLLTIFVSNMGFGIVMSEGIIYLRLRIMLLVGIL